MPRINTANLEAGLVAAAKREGLGSIAHTSLRGLRLMRQFRPELQCELIGLTFDAKPEANGARSLTHAWFVDCFGQRFTIDFVEHGLVIAEFHTGSGTYHGRIVDTDAHRRMQAAPPSLWHTLAGWWTFILPLIIGMTAVFALDRLAGPALTWLGEILIRSVDAIVLLFG
jgi:hypothetical protein